MHCVRKVACSDFEGGDSRYFATFLFAKFRTVSTVDDVKKCNDKCKKIVITCILSYTRFRLKHPITVFFANRYGGD